MLRSCSRRIDAAGFLIGALTLEEHRSFSEHLADSCEVCESEMAELTPVLALLDVVGTRTVGSDVEQVPSGLRRDVIAAVSRMPADESSSSIAAASPSVVPLATSARFDRRLLIAAAALVLLVVGGVAALRSSTTKPGTNVSLVAVQKDPLVASAQVTTQEPNTKGETTTAEFVVNGTIPGEIYFAWFEDPNGKRISLGSFRGATGTVRFRGQTGVARASIVAIGASTKTGDKPTDRMRADVPRA
jgi:Anti-sigma-K factor rskA